MNQTKINQLRAYVEKSKIAALCYRSENQPSDDLRERYAGAIDRAADLLDLSDLSPRMKAAILNGYRPAKPKADGEWQSNHGLKEMYDGYKINTAYELALQNLEGFPATEVSLKYPHFDVAKFQKKFGARLLGPVSGKYSTYDLWRDENSDYYTFEPGQIGEAGYGGAVFFDEDRAFAFVDWLLGSSNRHYLKDLSIGRQSLGGFSYPMLKKYYLDPLAAGVNRIGTARNLNDWVNGKTAAQPDSATVSF